MERKNIVQLRTQVKVFFFSINAMPFLVGFIRKGKISFQLHSEYIFRLHICWVFFKIYFKKLGTINIERLSTEQTTKKVSILIFTSPNIATIVKISEMKYMVPG